MNFSIFVCDSDRGSQFPSRESEKGVLCLFFEIRFKVKG